MDVNTQYDTLAASSSEDAPANTNSGDQSRPESWLSFTLFVLKLVLAVLIFRIFVLAPFSIPSESMLPRFWTGDYILAAKWPYGYSRFSLPFDAPVLSGRVLAGQPERGDMVIFKHPVDHKDYVKRVIGLPGDTVAVVNGQVVLNGKRVPRTRIGDFVQPIDQAMLDAKAKREAMGIPADSPCPRADFEEISSEGIRQCRYARYREVLPGGADYVVLDFGNDLADNFAPVTVPEGRMFVMGDNRDNSLDSRFPAAAGGGVGLVPQDNLVGQATIIMWSTDGSAEWIKPWTWFSSARWDRIGTVL
jgi:signal peptidase I